MLRNEETYKLPLDKNTYRAVKMQTGTTINVENYINDCINEYVGTSENGLFNTDNKYFWSESLLQRMSKVEEIREKRKAAGKKGLEKRWNKNEENKNEKKKKLKLFMTKNSKSIANAINFNSKCNSKCIANATKKYSKLIAKNSKRNEKKRNEKKRNEIKSIYPSNHEYTENKKLDEMLDEMDKIEFQKIVSNCNLVRLNPQLCLEISEIIKELFINPDTREKIDGISEKNVMYALKKFAVANTKEPIQIPKQYFKKCILSAMEQTELSSQYDIDTIYEMERD